MRVEWRSVITDSGGLSVMTGGTVQMLELPVDNLDTQELVCFLCCKRKEGDDPANTSHKSVNMNFVWVRKSIRSKLTL